MHKSLYIFFIVTILSLTSCRSDFETVPSTGKLEFSKETVYLDTVFTNISSSTYTLKVYNRSNQDITVPVIKLAKADSKYRIMVDGMTGVDDNNSGTGNGKIFNNVEILAKDSMYIFIETTVNINELLPNEFLYTDEIEFDSGNNLQKVNLVTLVQDAIFLYPDKYENGTKETILLGLDDEGKEVRVTGFELNENDPINGNELHFTNKKPYVIYGFAGVPPGKTLEIDPGARVYFHVEYNDNKSANSRIAGIIVQADASININGIASPNIDNPTENEVIFEGDRLEPGFSDTPGQWGTIWLRQGSKNNSINHLTLKNAVVGLLVENCYLNIKNSQIYNASNLGILARAATIDGENLVVNSAGQASFAATIGGSYDFRFCTFNNNWNSPKQFAVLLTNYETNEDESITVGDLVKANFYNCIIYGNNNVELFLDKYKEALFNYDFKYNLIKFNDSGTTIANNKDYDFIRNQTDGNIKNKNPNFFDININKLNIDDTSGAFQKGSATYLVPTDVNGNIRTSNPPDMGAYQSAPFPVKEK